MTRRLGAILLVLALTGGCAGTPPASRPAPSAATPAPAGGDEFRAAGAFVVSRHDGALLALLGFDTHARGWADFVGGREADESPAETALRELTEETRGAWKSVVTGQTLSSGSASRHRISGGVEIFLVEVPFLEASKLAARPGSFHAEKSHYCWVEVEALLNRVDQSVDRVRMPPDCDRPGLDGQLDIRAVTAANLRRGGALRPPLEDLLKP